MRIVARSLALLPLILLATGCPTSGTGTGGVTAEISISSQSGPAPLEIAVSGGSSSSTNGAIAAFAWDFGGEATADTASASHIFTDPGQYTVELTVTDDTGVSDSAAVTVQVEGAPPTADISASVLSGQAPLAVSFDAAGSSTPDDVLRDFFWDFDDGTTARTMQASHTFVAAGTYVVTLRVVTAGGVEDTAEVTIDVAEGTSQSLQFNGTQSALLPVTAGTFTAFTFEVYSNASDLGGTIVRFGAPVVTLEVLPGDNLIRYRAGVLALDATVTGLDDNWRHIAVTSDAAGTTSIYVDGELAATGTAVSSVTVSQITLGSGFIGNAARVRFWSVARSASEIAAFIDENVSASATGLLGDWPCDEGAGQTLDNRASGGSDGVRGASSAAESSDPAWSNDGP